MIAVTSFIRAPPYGLLQQKDVRLAPTRRLCTSAVQQLTSLNKSRAVPNSA
jgi:hypothetical protein